jgi:hypothetical protein
MGRFPQLGRDCPVGWPTDHREHRCKEDRRSALERGLQGGRARGRSCAVDAVRPESATLLSLGRRMGRPRDQQPRNPETRRPWARRSRRKRSRGPRRRRRRRRRIFRRTSSSRRSRPWKGVEAARRLRHPADARTRRPPRCPAAQDPFRLVDGQAHPQVAPLDRHRSAHGRGLRTLGGDRSVPCRLGRLALDWTWQRWFFAFSPRGHPAATEQAAKGVTVVAAWTPPTNARDG